MYNANQMSYSRSPSDFNNLPLLKTFRTKLRKGLTPAEAAFWRIVKNSRLDGKKFRRQHSIGRYILDFYCPSERLGIELDGDGHFSEQKQWYDSERKIFFKTDHQTSQLFVKDLAFAVIPFLLFRKVAVTIEFDPQSFRWTVKIENVTTNAMLAAEFLSIEPRVLNDSPERSLSWCQSFSKLGAKCFQQGKIVEIRWTSGVRH